MRLSCAVGERRSCCGLAASGAAAGSRCVEAGHGGRGCSREESVVALAGGRRRHICPILQRTVMFWMLLAMGSNQLLVFIRIPNVLTTNMFFG